MSNAKTIQLFLIDGDANGKIKCSLTSGWEGVAYKIPRTSIESAKSIELLQNPGIYFLFGNDEDDNESVYIGQANIRKNKKGVLNRACEPHPQIEEWTTLIAFVTNKETALGPTKLNYLENTFTNLAIKAGRYSVKNGNDPNTAKLSEEEKADMDLFVECATLFINTLGYKVLNPIISKAEKADEEKDELTFEVKKRGLHGYGLRTSEGFVLLAGSDICKEEDIEERWIVSLTDKRNRNSGKIRDYKTTEDILFKSPSGAANFVCGKSVNGRTAWLFPNGESLKDRGL